MTGGVLLEQRTAVSIEPFATMEKRHNSSLEGKIDGFISRINISSCAYKR